MSRKVSGLDTLDLRLLRELDGNARLSFVDLGKRLSVPPETARYRFNSLVESGVITALYSVIDAGMLGCSVHKVLMKLHNVGEAEVLAMAKDIADHRRVNWIVRMDSIFDLSFTMWASSIAEVSAFVDLLKEKYYRQISKISLSVNIDAEFLTRDPMSQKARELKRRARYTVPKTAYSIDRVDFDILTVLGSDPRASATSIAEPLGITSETVSKRIANLERRKIITAYRIVVDSAKLGEMNFYVLIYFSAASQERLGKFLEHCRAHPNVNYIIKALGEWDYELNVEAKGTAECRALIMDLTKNFSDIIRDYQNIPVSAIYKFMIMPPGAADHLPNASA